MLGAPNVLVRAALWGGLTAAALAAAGRTLGGGLRGHACAPVACTPTPPTPAEAAALTAEADRLLARYADDSTAVGRRCRALGATMRERLGDVRMMDYMWRAADADGLLAAVTGDAHPVEAEPGTGRVHIARGYDALNPDRGLPAVLQTARHEFAHVNGLRQPEGWGMDRAALLATACAPADAVDASGR